MKKTLFIIVIIIVCANATSCGLESEGNANNLSKEAEVPIDTIRYELPSFISQRSEQVIEHIGYTVNYNREWHIPNWVAYELTEQEIDGTEKRLNYFLVDPMAEGEPVKHEEYSNSEYEHGHMAPAGDMGWSKQVMQESFYTTNVCPQNPNNNRGDWKDLEELIRDWARQYGNVYICCGPIVENTDSTIGHDVKVVVPKEFFKVILRRDEQSWYAIGFVMQNIAQSRPLMTYAMCVDDVETRTGIDFFYQLPDSIEQVVEKDFDFADWIVKK